MRFGFKLSQKCGGKHGNQNMAVGRNVYQVHPFSFDVDVSEHTRQSYIPQSYVPLETIRLQWLCQ